VSWRIKLGVIVVFLILATAFAQKIHDNARLASGKNAWFIVRTSTIRSSYTLELIRLRGESGLGHQAA
jgi:hypothetical protein